MSQELLKELYLWIKNPMTKISQLLMIYPILLPMLFKNKKKHNNPKNLEQDFITYRIKLILLSVTLTTPSKRQKSSKSKDKLSIKLGLKREFDCKSNQKLPDTPRVSPLRSK